MKEIKFPTQKTYFITYTNDRICAYGVVEPDQEMVTGQPNLYQTINENEWLAELQNYFVFWGYQFCDEDSANFAKNNIDLKYGNNSAIINFAQYNNPQFWYILGDFPEVMGDAESFQVFSN